MMTIKVPHENFMKYSLKCVAADFAVDGNPGKNVWQGIEELQLASWSWHDCSKYPPPRVSAKSLYSAHGIYVIFRVKENFILARHTEFQDEVWKDSCVEFFVAPNLVGYFNFEISCIGTLLLHWNEPGKEHFEIPVEDVKNVVIKSSLGNKTIGRPVLGTENGYTVECFFPFSLFIKYSDAKLPSPGESWNANFYKCGDKTPEPSWGSWSPVNKPKPSFHHPEYFGEIIFE